MKASGLLAPLLAYFSLSPDGAGSGDNGISWVTGNWDISRGRPFTIEWAGHNGPVTVTLVESKKTVGDEKWEEILEVTSGNEETSLVFKSPDHLTYDTEYAFEVKDATGRRALSPRWILNIRQISSGIGGQLTTSTETPEPSTTQGNESPATTDAQQTTADNTAGSSPSRTGQGSSSTQTSSPGSNTGSDSGSDSNSDSSSNGGGGRRSSGLGRGARIGIGVGVVLVVSVIVTIISWFIVRRRKRNNTAEVENAPAAATQADPKIEGPPAHQGPHEMQGAYMHTEPPKQELAAGQGYGYGYAPGQSPPGQVPGQAPGYPPGPASGYPPGHTPGQTPAPSYSPGYGPGYSPGYAPGYAPGYGPQYAQGYELHGETRVEHPSELDPGNARPAELGQAEPRLPELPAKQY